MRAAKARYDESMKNAITVETTVNVPVAKAWEIFNKPEHIVKWNSPSPDWHTPRSTNDLKVGGRFTCRMEAKDGSAGFDLAGTYDKVETNKHIAYTMDGEDKRKVDVRFEDLGGRTRIVETFDPENENPLDFQKAGWQAILDSFKMYAEGI